MGTDREASRETDVGTDKTDSIDRQRDRQHRQADGQTGETDKQLGRQTNGQTSLMLELVARHLGLALCGIVIIKVACGLQQV